VHGPQIAEWVIMMDLVHSHSFPKLYDLQREKAWKQKEGMNVSDRVGKRVGILGYGSIGRQGMFWLIFFEFFELLVETLHHDRDQKHGHSVAKPRRQRPGDLHPDPINQYAACYLEYMR
jgi:phosphoglycerate dehydrogenase-like enzyme